MDTHEIYLAEVREDEVLESHWSAFAGERLLSRSLHGGREGRWEAITYCDGYNQALHDFLLPPSIYDEVEDED